MSAARARKPPREAYPGQGRKHVQLQLAAAEVRGLRTIMAWMLDDPEQAASKIGHQSAVIYAIRHTLANPPAHVRGNRG